MRTVAEIKQDILALPEADCADLCRWVLDQDWERWEREFDEDVRLAGWTLWRLRRWRPRPGANSKTCRCTGRIHVSGGSWRICPNRCSRLPAETSSF